METTESDWIQYGDMTALHPAELLAIAASRHSSEVDSRREQAQKFLVNLNSMDRLGQVGFSDLEKHFGMERFDAARFRALVELGRRSANARPGSLPAASNPAEIWAYLRPRYGNEKQEFFIVLILDAKLKVMRSVDVFKGTTSSAPAAPREVIREALKDGATAIAVAHNHPSGDPTPSQADILATNTLKTACDLFDIDLVDHLIIGHHDYVSMKKKGLM